MIRKKQLATEEVSIVGEAEYIVQCARNRDGRVITLGQLLFFSTRSGDAWMFDPAD